MHQKEAIINFVSRFCSHVQVLTDTTKDPKDPLSDKELSTFFIKKLCSNQSIEGDIRHTLLDCKRELYNEASSKTLTNFEDELCLAENQACRGGTGSTNLHCSKSTGRDIVCGFCGKKGHAASACYSNPANRRQQAHYVQCQGAGRGGPMQCFACGLSHSLSVCPTTTPERQEQIY
jgi:hypothetical protein